MNTPGDIYKNDDGLCFVPDVKLSFDKIMELMKLNMTICSSDCIEDDWQYLRSINKPSRRKFVHGNYHVEMLDVVIDDGVKIYDFKKESRNKTPCSE